MDDPIVLLKIKADLAADHGPKEALAALKHDADKALNMKPLSVMDKPAPGPSGDKHDYASYAPYFWPNPKTPTGLPYIRKDGYHNTDQTSKGDAHAYEPLLAAIHTLGLAYWYTGNPAYAQHAALLARTWFLDPATRMNPNLKYAQAVLGVNDGRGTGLLEDRALPLALDGLTLIDNSGAWTDADKTAMKSWVQTFDQWLSTSQAGADERAAKNNHGSWFAVQEAGLYLWLGEKEKATKIFENAKQLIANQIQPTGRQPLEIARADGFSYSTFNAQALATLATMAKRSGIDLWTDTDATHGSLKKAIDYLLPFAAGQQKWKDNQLKPITPAAMIPVVIEAAAEYPDKKYPQWLAAQEGASTNRSLLTGTVSAGGEPKPPRKHEDPIPSDDHPAE
jgi:Alginate lyase